MVAGLPELKVTTAVVQAERHRRTAEQK